MFPVLIRLSGSIETITVHWKWSCYALMPPSQFLLPPKFPVGDIVIIDKYAVFITLPLCLRLIFCHWPIYLLNMLFWLQHQDLFTMRFVQMDFEDWYKGGYLNQRNTFFIVWLFIEHSKELDEYWGLWSVQAQTVGSAGLGPWAITA